MRADPRQQLIAEMRDHLERDSFPRLTILVILFVAGFVAFLTSAFALWAGMTSMALRYALAVMSGYAGFLLTLRAWLMYRQGLGNDSNVERLQLASDLNVSPPLPRSWFASDSRLFSLDLDDLWWLLLLIAAILGAAATIVYVIYDAPILLAEVALDAGLLSAIYQRHRHWSRTAFRRTWLAATSLAIFMSIAGSALGHLVPHAHSIGDVLRAII